MKTIRIQGMSCRHCVESVTRVLSAIEGVSNVRVDLEKGEAAYEETGVIDDQKIREEIRKAGYEVL